ncbi:TauD/TfdA family dioxygenase [Nocardia gipuzkoensis]
MRRGIEAVEQNTLIAPTEHEETNRPRPASPPPPISPSGHLARKGEIGAVELTASERDQVTRILDELAAEFSDAEDPELPRRIGSWGHLLPAALREPLLELRYGETLAGLVVKGGPVSADPGPTPRHWREYDRSRTAQHDWWLLLLVAQLGDVVCWSTLQNGRLIADVLPVAGHEEAQTGHGSRAELQFHVEDAFDDDRCDAFALACLRNPDAVPTTVASTACLDLNALDVEILAEPRFRIAPDPEHLRGLPHGEHIQPRARAVLTEAAVDARLRVDPAFTAPAAGDKRAATAFEGLCEQLRAGTVDLVLGAGDVLLLDNHRTVHGRRSFRPRYDGTDRWLRKASVIRDLRRTRSRRVSADSRILLPR